MIVTIDHKTSNLLAGFLKDARRIPMAKRDHAALARLEADLKSRQVNSQRFEHSYPTVQAVHSNLHVWVGAICRWKLIARWKRWTILPALLEYIFKMQPAKRRYVRRLNEVAREFHKLRGQFVQVPK